MARLQLDQRGEAFFDLILSRREEGYGAIAHLRVPKGAGRSTLVLHEEFAWGEDPEECKRFIKRLGEGQGGQGITFLRNDAAYFSFWRRPDGTVLFEARCLTGCGEVLFRAEVGPADVERFHRKLEEVCGRISRGSRGEEE